MKSMMSIMFPSQLSHYMHDFVVIVLMGGFLATFLESNTVLVVMAVCFLLLRFKKTHEKPSQKKEWDEEIESWLQTFETSMKNDDEEESIRSYHILLSMIRQEQLVFPKKHNEIEKKINIIFSKEPLLAYKVQNTILPLNAYESI